MKRLTLPCLLLLGFTQSTHGAEMAMGFREQVPMGDSTYRTIRWGKGLQIWLVEGRRFRSPNDMPDGREKK